MSTDTTNPPEETSPRRRRYRRPVRPSIRPAPERDAPEESAEPAKAPESRPLRSPLRSSASERPPRPASSPTREIRSTLSPIRQATDRVRQIHRILVGVLKELDEVTALLGQVEDRLGEDDQEIIELRRALNELQIDRSNRARPRYPSSASSSSVRTGASSPVDNR